MSQNHETHALPPELQDLVEQELKPDEQLLWVGQPVFPVLGLMIAVLIGINVTGGSVLWMCLGIFGLGAPLWFALLGIPFVLAGLALPFALFRERRRMKETVYAITNQRAIIFVKKSGTTEIVSYNPEELSNLLCRESLFGGGGNISFGESTTIKFECVPSPRKVERLLKDLAAKAPKEEKPKPLKQYADPPILHHISSTPREVPLSLRLYLRLYSGDSPVALIGWLIAGFGFAFTTVGLAIPDLLGKLIFIGLSLPFGVAGLYLVFYVWFISGPKVIHFVQNGTATKTRHFATWPTGKKNEDQPEMQVDFEYQVDGQKYTASAQGYDISRLTDTPCKVVLYDPIEPMQSILLDTLPRGIYFDEWTGQFRVNPLWCVPSLLAAIFVCGEIVAMVMLAIWGF